MTRERHCNRRARTPGPLVTHPHNHVNNTVEPPVNRATLWRRVDMPRFGPPSSHPVATCGGRDPLPPPPRCPQNPGTPEAAPMQAPPPTPDGPPLEWESIDDFLGQLTAGVGPAVGGGGREGCVSLHIKPSDHTAGIPLSLSVAHGSHLPPIRAWLVGFRSTSLPGHI